MNKEERTNYFDILRMSEEYIKAFQILTKNNNNTTNLFHVKFYLLAHSIELSLKAYLRYKKYSLSDLRSLGHDLTGIYTELESNFTYKLDNKSIEIIKAINLYYKSKEFEYPTTGVKHVIPLDELNTVAGLILKSTEWQINTEDSN
jgi:hypothetical protein